MIVSKNYQYIKEPTHTICKNAYQSLRSFTKDTESWELFISQNPDESRDTMLEIINELLLDYQIPTEEEALNGVPCEDLRAEFEPHYDGVAPF